MNNEMLENTLRAYARQPLSPCPPDLSVGVWRDIESRRRKASGPGLFAALDWHELFIEPRVAVMSLAFAVVVGTASATILSRVETTRALAREAIHFEFFSPDAPAQLHSLFVRPPAAELLP